MIILLFYYIIIFISFYFNPTLISFPNNKMANTFNTSSFSYFPDNNIPVRYVGPRENNRHKITMMLEPRIFSVLVLFRQNKDTLYCIAIVVQNHQQIYNL